MISYSYITDIDGSDAEQTISLYRAEGWWYDDALPDLDTERLRAIIRGSHCFLVARSGEAIIGMGRAISDGVSDAYIQDVSVADAFRGQGVGTGIVRRLVEQLTADGLEWIALIAEKHSNPFYDRLGFREMPNAVPMLIKHT